MKDRVEIWDKAPDFSLPSHSGVEIRLGDFFGKKPVVLYFYLKDFAPGCTKQACAFRDSYEAFKDAGTEVIGVGSQSVESHRLFAAQFDLPFVLLSDERSEVRELYGVPKSMGTLPGRATYVIDKDGIVRLIFISQTHIDRHTEEALRMIRSFRH